MLPRSLIQFSELCIGTLAVIIGTIISVGSSGVDSTSASADALSGDSSITPIHMLSVRFLVAFAFLWSGILFIRSWYIAFFKPVHSSGPSPGQTSSHSSNTPFQPMSISSLNRRSTRTQARTPSGSSCPKPILPRGPIHVLPTAPEGVARDSINKSNMDLPNESGRSGFGSDVSTDASMAPVSPLGTSFVSEDCSPISNCHSMSLVEAVSVPDSIAAIWEPVPWFRHDNHSIWSNCSRCSTESL